MRFGWWRADLLPVVRRCATLCGLALVLSHSASFGQTAICDPPGPAPRFGCQWSTDICDWICPVCDPFGLPPRSTCTWDGNLCDWSCPGYTGVQVTVQTTRSPVHDATLYIRLSSLCTATGAGAFCNGSIAVSSGMTAAQKCEAIVEAIAGNCTEAGYAVTVNDCLLEASLTASNVECPATPFALGLSNDPTIFDQTEQGRMPDGEIDSITGTTGDCVPMPGPVSNLRLATANGGADLQLTWHDTTNADDYVVFADPAANGTFSTVVGTAPGGASGWTVSMPPGSGFYLVAGRNSICGIGPRH